MEHPLAATGVRSFGNAALGGGADVVTDGDNGQKKTTSEPEAGGHEVHALAKTPSAGYTEYVLREQYDRDVETGWISPLSGFENYKTLYNRIQNEAVGSETANGILITGQVPHFMQRVIGTKVDPKIFREEHQVISRSGVEVDAIKNAVFTPEKIGDVMVRRSGQRSVKFIGKDCVVTINPDTGELIQTNPLGG